MSAGESWQVVNTCCDPHTLGQWSSVATISNGYLGLNGRLAEQRDGAYPVTLINGVYDELDMFSLLRPSAEDRRYLDPRYFDAAGKSPAVANLPNPLAVRTFIGEREISLGRGEVRDFVQTLDLRTGAYRYRFDYRDGAGRTTRVEMERFAALRHAHRVLMRYTITPIDHEASVCIYSGIDADVRSNLTGERVLRVSQLWTDPPERCRLVAHLPARAHDVRAGVLNHLTRGGPAAETAGVVEHDAVYTRYRWDRPRRGQPLSLERYVVLTSSEDLRHGLVADLEIELDAAAAQGFDDALQEQRAAWQGLWDRCDVQIDGDDPAQLGLRFCLYHLLAAGPRFSDRLSVPVKFLTGEYYQGNAFYDTDLYILPFYTFTQPDLARTCLNYRWHGLRPAREIARNLGCDGAKFAWQAGPQGEECLGRWWRFTHTNIHINADVAHALMLYHRATGNDTFMAERGVDMLVETARFYASRAVHDAARGRYDLRDVAGPDEGHCESTNNFYTNALAMRNLRNAADGFAELARTNPTGYAAAVQRLALRAAEPDRWREVAARLTLLFDPETRLYEQCEGFFRLRPLPPDLLAARREWFVTVAPYQALNQPDVLMALMLLRDEFPADVRRANYEYYYRKSLNFSSMSFALNALAALDAGDVDEAYRQFVMTTGMDLDESLTGRQDTHAGLHGTAAGGAWLAAVCGFGGVRLTADGIHIDPTLPPAWQGLRFRLLLRGVEVRVAIDRNEVTLVATGEPQMELPVTLAGQRAPLTHGRRVVRYRGS
jgi:trehalose/maltose hydrolase-like predicted phosphorylase